MRHATRLSDTVHLLAFIQIVREIQEKRGKDACPLLTSAAIAKSIHTHPAYVRQLMATLRKANLLHGERGKANPVLARPAAEISLLDIYRAVEGVKPLLHLDTHTNPLCHVGVLIQHALGEAYQQIQHSTEASMAALSLQDIISAFYTRAGQNVLPM